jgi:uncharacterized delta-60 repeat protein
MKKLLLSYLLLFLSCYAFAQLDSSFGTNGKAIIPVGSLGDVAYATARQTDGKIIAAGYSAVSGRYDFSVVRLNSNGSLDNSFDGDGKAIITSGTYGSICYAAAIQTDGKILLAGIAVNDDYDFAIIRLNINGSLDSSFDGDGIKVIPVSDPFFNDECYAITLQADGKILLAGYASYAPNNSFQDFAVVRLNTDGSLDSSFAGDGHDVYPVSQFGDKAYGIAVQTDGKIVLAGESFINDHDIAVLRINSDGSEDSTFAGDGYAFISNGYRDECRAIKIQTDGKIVVAGRLRNQSDGINDYEINRLNTDGTLDNSFSSDGALVIGIGATDDLATSTALQQDGKIVVAGYSNAGNFTNTVSLIRLQTNGDPDSCFSDDGKLIITSAANEYATAVLVQPDNKIVLAGATGPSNAEDFVLYRLLGNCGPCPDQDNDGYTTCQGDCNDNNPNIHPGATEVCNGLDDNCNGQVDEGVLITFYQDADSDGYGNPYMTIQACSAPAGYVNNNTDCNDNNPNINPGATEICNGIDDDCDGLIDEGLLTTYYADLDGDGYGNPVISIQVCNPTTGYVANNEDCNDSNPLVNPGATEICNNNIDDDCDQLIDEQCSSPYTGGIGDGHDTARLETQVFGPPPYYTPYYGGNGDGHDTARLETQFFGPPLYYTPYYGGNGDGHDTTRLESQAFGPPVYFTPYYGGNGDGHTMTVSTCNINTYYRDADNDGYGNIAVTTQACSLPTGYVNNNTDCNDNNATVHPGTIEICGNNTDDNCNGLVDENSMTATISPSGTVSLCQGTSLLLTANNGAGFTYQWYRNNLLLTGQTGITLTVTQPGNYYVVITNAGNCTATAVPTTVNMTNSPPAGITIQGNPNNCPVNLMAHPGGPGVTYQWFKNNLVINGAISRNYTAGTSGNYTVKVTKDGCYDISSPMSVTSCPQSMARQDITSVLKEDTVAGLTLFNVKVLPNPSSNDFTLHVLTGSNEMITITLFDAGGKFVKTIKSRPNVPIRFGSNWIQGIYMADVRQGKNHRALKLVKM